MQLGCIVIESKYRRVIEQVPFINYTESVPDDISNPVLIIGWNRIKTLYPEQSIINHQISDNIWWTFNPNERRTDYEKHLKMFYKKIFNTIKQLVTYRFINVFELGYHEASSFIKMVKAGDCYIYVHMNSFIYIYKRYGSTVFGVNLDDIEYMGIKTNDVIRMFYNSHNIIKYDLSFIPGDIKEITNDDKYLIPYIMSLLFSSPAATAVVV
jgi:hypothetical protein